MQHKLCLWLAVALVFGALAAGNPFLRCAPSDAAVAPSALVAGGPPAAPPVWPEAAASPGTAWRQPPAASLALHVGGGEGLPRTSPVSAALAPRQLSGGTALASVARSLQHAARAECPDPLLAPLVVDVQWVGEQPVWCLRDGRRLVRNPRGDQPLLVPAAADLK